MSLASSILQRVSRILSHGAVVEEDLREIAQTVAVEAGLDSVRIAIENPLRGTSYAASLVAETQDVAGVVVSRDLRSDSYVYGHIEIQASKPKIRAVELFQFVGALEAILLNFSVLQARLAEQRYLKARLSLLEEELRTRKYTARAQSILAQQGMAGQEAQAWLEQESRRARLPLSLAAEKLIRRYRRQQREAA